MTPEDERDPGRRQPPEQSSSVPHRPEQARPATLSGGEFAGVGLQFAATFLAFLFVGRWLDGRLGTTPWLTLIFLFVGAGGAFYSMYRKLMAAQKRARDAKEREDRQ